MLATKDPRITVHQATPEHDVRVIQKVLSTYGDVTGFSMLDSIEKCVRSGFSCVVLLDRSEIVGVTVSYKRKTDGVIKTNATAIYEHYRGVGAWKQMITWQLQFGEIEWKTVVDAPSNEIFARFARLLRVEPGNKRHLNVWRLVKWDDPLAYCTIRGHPYKYPHSTGGDVHE